MLGGVDVTGPHLYSIHPHGSTDKLPYVTMVSHYRYQGYISAALVLGGVDVTGPHLYVVYIPMVPQINYFMLPWFRITGTKDILVLH